MSGLFFNLANLLRLRGGPQHLPVSRGLMALLLTVYMVQNLVTGQQLEDENAAVKTMVAIGLQVIVLAALLYWRRHTERFVQTLSAFAAVGIVFNAITWALIQMSNPALDQPLLVMSWFAVFIWSLFVDANIYRHALSIKFSMGMLITVLLLAASYIIIEKIFIT